MNSQDELRDLWCDQAPTVNTKGEDMLALVVRKNGAFERRIAVRNTIEICAAALVVVAFAVAGFHMPSAMEAAGMWVTSASGVWLIFFLWKRGGNREAPPHTVDLVSYQRHLVGSIDHQIRLLSNVKYWYLLPPYAGIAIANAGGLMRVAHQRGLAWYDVAPLVIVTLIFGAVWVLNEVYGVRALRAEKQRLLSLTEGESR